MAGDFEGLSWRGQVEALRRAAEAVLPGYELTGALLPEPVTGMFEVVAMPEPQAA